MDQIKDEIKSEIISHIVGIKIPCRGTQKILTKINEWWKFSFPDDFDPVSIPETGPTQTSVCFTLRAVLEEDSNHSYVKTIKAHYRPITIYFENSKYQKDCSKAAICMIDAD